MGNKNRKISVSLWIVCQFFISALVLGHVPNREEPKPKSECAVAFLGDSRPARQLREMIDKVARTQSNVLLLGETGSGKEVVARLVHDQSSRREKPFVAVNCSALTETLLNSTLFGHQKGSFTGAYQDAEGVFEQASGGTLFLDEIGDMPLSTQTSLLRVLEEKKITRVGGAKLINVDVRLVAATNVNLVKAVSEGKFRKDLFFRINVLPISIPSLHERNEDVPQLARHFLVMSAIANGIDPVPTIPAEVMELLKAHVWPGNVRELQNLIIAASIMGTIDGEIGREFVEERLRTNQLLSSGPVIETLPFEQLSNFSLRRLECWRIRIGLERANGNQSKAASELKLNRNTLAKKVKECQDLKLW